jgi:hypothetical protein
MADYGIKIKNASNEIQIDSTYRNYVLEKSGSLTASQISSAVSITNNPEPPIVAVRPTDATDKLCGVWDLQYSAPNYTGVRFFGTKIWPNSSDLSCSLDYKIFTLSTTKSDETYGLRIYDSDEDLVYDSGYTPFKILEVGSISVDTTYTHASHTSPYYIYSPCQQQWFDTYTPRTVQFMRLGLAKQSTTSVKPIWGSVVGISGGAGMSTYYNTGTTATLILCE